MPDFARLDYFRDIARELTWMAEADELDTLIYIFQMAAQAAEELLQKRKQETTAA